MRPIWTLFHLFYLTKTLEVYSCKKIIDYTHQIIEARYELVEKSSKIKFLQWIKILSIFSLVFIFIISKDASASLRASRKLLSETSTLCAEALTRVPKSLRKIQRMKVLSSFEKFKKSSTKNRMKRKTRSNTINVNPIIISETQPPASSLWDSLQNIYHRSQSLIHQAKFSIGQFLDHSFAVEDAQKHESAYFLMEKLFGPMSQDPLAEELRIAVLNDAATRDTLRPLEVHIDRLTMQVQREEEVSPLHRYLIRILVDIIWKFQGGDHPFVKKAMSLIEKLDTPPSQIIQVIGVFEQAISYFMKSQRISIEKAIEVVLGQDSVFYSHLKKGYLIESPSNFNEVVTREMLLVTYLHLGQRINEVRKNIKLEPTKPHLQDLRDKLKEISPSLTELSSIFGGFWVLEEIGRIDDTSYELSSLFDYEIKGPIENLLNYISSAIQIRSFTDIEAVFLRELIKAIAFGGISHPFIQDSIRGFIDRPTAFENIRWIGRVDTTIQRIAVLQQVDRYYQNILHRQANYIQILDLVLEYKF